MVQEALVKAYRSLDRFRDGAPFRPWLLRIVANETHNLTRARARRGVRERTADSLSLPLRSAGPGNPEDYLDQAQSREALLSAVSELPEAMRRVVTCRYLLDLNESETATVLNLPRGTVKSRLNRAQTKLRVLVPTELAHSAEGGGHHE